MGKTRTTHSFLPVWLKNGKCPGEKWHFRGCAREVYGYLKKLSENHGGFIFASIPQITKRTKKWKSGAEPYSQREVEYVLRDFIRLGILGPRCTRTIHGREYTGWQFYPHANWTCDAGGLCEFVKIEQFTQQNCGVDCGTNCGKDFGVNEQNCGTDFGVDCGMHPAIIEDKSERTQDLQVSVVS